ncbi:MAG: CPBP family intramembrane metalloprotease [Microlunatus sp.]|nr:CPBP family intramembrane metalloprotease [Microlunatus sp.]
MSHATTRRVPVPASPGVFVGLGRQLVEFALVCLVISWGLWLVCGFVGGSVAQSPLLWIFVIAASGPSLAALVIRVVRGRRLGRAHPRGAPWVWLPMALILGAAPAMLTSFLVEPQGFVERIATGATSAIDAGGGPMLFVTMYLIAGPFAEEFGWRWYVQPRLRARFGPLMTSLVLGVGWAIWHVPLFFLTGTGQSKMGMVTVQGALFFATLVPLSLIFLFVSETLRGGVLAAIAIHFAGNVALAFAPQTSPVSAVVNFIIVLLIAVLCYVWITPSSPPALGECGLS